MAKNRGQGGCNEKLVFTYTIGNKGPVPLIVEELTRQILGIDGLYYDNLMQGSVLKAGEDVVLEEQLEIDLCEGVDMAVLLSIEANPDNGPECEDMDQYDLNLDGAPTKAPTESPTKSPTKSPTPPPTPSPTKKMTPSPTKSPTKRPTPVPTLNPTKEPPACIVDIDIKCSTDFGYACTSIRPPNAKCSLGQPVRSLSFTAIPDKSCKNKRNQQIGQSECVDHDKYKSGDLQMVCKDMDNNLLYVDPPTILEGGVFTVMATREWDDLPDKINCEVQDDRGNPLQSNIIDTSGKVPLHLKERYGLLQVEACGDQSCIQGLDFGFVIENLGRNEVTISDILVDYNSNSAINLASGKKKLESGVTTDVTELVYLDVCKAGGLVVNAQVKADQESGPSCSRNEDLEFSFEPQCSLGVTLACFEEATSKPCSELFAIRPEPCECPENTCPTSFSYQYTGDNCDGRSSGLVDCTDDLPFKPETARVLAKRPDGSVFFESEVEEGSVIDISDGGACLPDELELSIVDIESRSTVFQTVSLSNTCGENGALISESFGAVEFAGFSCSDGSGESCLVDVEFETCVANEGSVPLEVTAAVLMMEDVEIDVDTSAMSGSIETGEMYCASVVQSISLCGVESIEATVEVEADDPSDTGCIDDTDFSIPLTLAPTPAPSPFPTPSPTPGPSPSPTPAPTPSPTPAPTKSPTTFPTGTFSTSSFDGLMPRLTARIRHSFVFSLVCLSHAQPKSLFVQEHQPVLPWRILSVNHHDHFHHHQNHPPRARDISRCVQTE